MGPLNFIGTGSVPVDQVLWAVECAATDYHNTNEWSEPTYDGPSHVELIQTAAKSAAAELDRLRAENAALRERVAAVEEWTHRFGSELSPSGKWTDSFGDGVRTAKDRVSRLLAAAKPTAQRPTPSPETLAERAPPPPADLVQATQDGEHPAIHAKGVEGMKAVRMPKGKEAADG